ncbi:YgjV family protein [Halomonas piscis]|uniref:YgjV family protein n=1 Tax=Halomonas piscis TaxID=3031727 RepID=A0ABY9Z1K3_9GAMM|nr:YgjV family protein [Halomonas piscis]WNK21016.1 YgjV family protein [Halomonas piscis]
MYDTLGTVAGQFFGLVALILSVLAFSSRQDDRLMVLLLSANVAFALQFAMFQSWTAAALSLLVLARIECARRYPRSKMAMAAVLTASLVAAWLTWQSWADLPAVAAMVLGTVGMFLLSGIPMRVLLGLAAVAWTLSHLIVGSVGGALAEMMIIVTNAVTVYRLYRIRQRYPGVID